MDNKTIKLITLNAWCGRAMYPLMRFFRKHKANTDIFCLQEVRNSTQARADESHPDEYIVGPLFEKIAQELADFEGRVASFEDDPTRMSVAAFYRKDLPVKDIGDFVMYMHGGKLQSQVLERGSVVFSPRKLQYFTLDINGKEVLIVNYHGLWNNGPKTDTPDRIEQSRKIKSFLDKYNGPKIICGDFNLLPDTKSMDILREGMVDLTKEYKVESTRTPMYRHYENPDEPNFADYILVTPDVKVEDFKVMPDLASDHSPLYLEFSV